jgi:hypothetical protein
MEFATLDALAGPVEPLVRPGNQTRRLHFEQQEKVPQKLNPINCDSSAFWLVNGGSTFHCIGYRSHPRQAVKKSDDTIMTAENCCHPMPD